MVMYIICPKGFFRKLKSFKNIEGISIQYQIKGNIFTENFRKINTLLEYDKINK